MRHDHLQVGITGQHIAADHVGHGAGRFRQVFLHGERRLRHHLAVDGVRTVRMQDDDRPALVKHGKERVQFRYTQVLSLNISRQLDAVGTQRIECIDGLADGSLNIGQWQCGAEQESPGMLPLDAGRLLIGGSHHVCRFRLRGSKRQHRGLDTRLVHPPQMALHIVFR